MTRDVCISVYRKGGRGFGDRSWDRERETGGIISDSEDEASLSVSGEEGSFLFFFFFFKFI